MTEPSAGVDMHRRVVLPVLVVLTVVTGLVDAVSFLGLEQVFVAVMTGNVVFLGLGLAGAPDAPVLEPLLALAAFTLGAACGGRVIARWSGHRGRVLLAGVALELVLVLAAAVVTLAQLHLSSRAAALAVVVLMACGLAVQNAVVRHLGVRDFTTTLLTLTLTGMAADSHPAGGSGAHVLRRGTSVLALFTGALIGGLFVVRAGVGPPLLLVAALLVVVLGMVWRGLRHSAAAAWEAPKQ